MPSVESLIRRGVDEENEREEKRETIIKDLLDLREILNDPWSWEMLTSLIDTVKVW